ncbi:TPA: hypothetical protein ACMD15_003437 [Vibrio cholerae]
MRVIASKMTDYTFFIEPYEWSAIKNTEFIKALNNQLINVSQSGLTLGVYDSVPERMIKNERFFGQVCPRTRAIYTKTDFLTEIGLCVSINSGEIIKIDNLFENSMLTIEPDHYRFVCNHIPQIFYPSPLGIITCIDGVYNFDNGLFKGLLMFDQ